MGAVSARTRDGQARDSPVERAVSARGLDQKPGAGGAGGNTPFPLQGGRLRNTIVVTFLKTTSHSESPLF